ncbi:protein disulfide isomerase-like 2-3 [Artemisia annua]|uniref:Protein disulfide isomerase-like 2-3 n=1 Tax=Artemisia annua TaxID=35608 RepID=A0A2U1QJD0_ARTAN|nr:protein disulfide isomerase-like 2-3 [Artemisia annua]
MKVVAPISSAMKKVNYATGEGSCTRNFSWSSERGRWELSTNFHERAYTKVTKLQKGRKQRYKKKHGKNVANVRKQPELESHVEIGGYSYPTLVALNVKKGAYAPIKSASKRDRIIDFVKAAGLGRKGTPTIGTEMVNVKKVSKPTLPVESTKESNRTHMATFEGRKYIQITGIQIHLSLMEFVLKLDHRSALNSFEGRKYIQITGIQIHLSLMESVLKLDHRSALNSVYHDRYKTELG